jgi:hypothetical protein
MADLSNILAALAARQGGTPSQAAPPPPIPGYPPPQFVPAPSAAPYGAMPQPISSGSVDLAGMNIQPVSSGSVSIADAIAKARGIAAEKGLSYDPSRRKQPLRKIFPTL